MDSSDAELEEQWDQVDLFHTNREKAARIEHDDGREYMAVHESSEDEDEFEEVMSLDVHISSSEEERENEKSTSSFKAWGKKRANYYAEESNAERGLEEELEESEALSIQRQQATMLSEKDFEGEYSENEIVLCAHEREDKLGASDFSQLPSEDKCLLMSRRYPELAHIINSVRHSLISFQKKVFLIDSCDCSSEMEIFLETSIHLNLCLSLNAMYYLLLTASGKLVQSLPITGKLLQLMKLMEKLEDFDESVSRKKPSLTVWSDEGGRTTQQSSANSGREMAPIEDSLTFYRRIDAEKEHKRKCKGKLVQTTERSCEETENTNEKRAITYQIARNKGIGLKTRRQLRNPRVKHKLKYKKALLKRKSRVLPVAKELCKYAGEITGIKTNLAKSTKIL